MPVKKTRKIDKSQKIFRPGSEKRDIFRLVLSIISKLFDEKKVGIEVDSDGDIVFSLDISKIKDFVSKEIKDKLSFDDFMNVISTEIESLVEASVYSDKTVGIENNIPSSILKEVGIDEFLWRLEEVEKVVNVPKALKQDLIFKKTTKGMILKEIKWEINNKTYDEDFGQLDNCKYATLSILYSQPSTEVHIAKLSSGGLSIQLPSVDEPKQITLELQKMDITKLIDNLQQILEIF